MPRTHYLSEEHVHYKWDAGTSSRMRAATVA
jgi:hypothetical protein